MIDELIEKYSDKLSVYSPNRIITVVTVFVILSSIPLIYALAVLFNVQYTNSIFILSIIAPLLLSPITLHVIIQLSKHLKYYKDSLAKEVEENKKKDLMLFEQTRFAFMGEMMANISHQWKQPLNTIGLAVVTLKTSNICEEKADKYFDIMEDNVKHLATTINDFMSFFDQKTYTELRTLESIVKEIKSIIYTNISDKNIKLEILIDTSHKDVRVASSISQVILNLINNAKDAFVKDSKNKQIRVLFLTTKHGLEIECCDNGKGIPEDIRGRIFDPYFTTKAKEQGTGIGLYMSKKIIQKIFNGEINLSSKEHNKNLLNPLDNYSKTCFFITLPYSDNCVLIEEQK